MSIISMSCIHGAVEYRLTVTEKSVLAVYKLCRNFHTDSSESFNCGSCMAKNNCVLPNL